MKTKGPPKPAYEPNDWVRITSGAFFDCIGQVACAFLQPSSPQYMYRVAWIACVDGKPVLRFFGQWHDETALELVNAAELFEGQDFTAA